MERNVNTLSTRLLYLVLFFVLNSSVTAQERWLEGLLARNGCRFALLTSRIKILSHHITNPVQMRVRT